MLEIAGHRGAAGLRPENTLAGFRRALELGCPWVECDVHATRDGHVVVIHDATLERTTNGRGNVGDHTLAELRRLDAGGGEAIPTLEEVLTLVKGRARFLCELKDPNAVEAAVAAVAAHKMVDTTVFISFQWDALRKTHALLPGAAVAPLTLEPDPVIVDAAVDMGAVAVDLYFRVIHPGLVERIREAGLALYTFTPNTPRLLYAMAALGVDVVTTDRPDWLLPHASDANTLLKGLDAAQSPAVL
jgi:glycerophosphoryl diester phosphodiesterase